MNLEHIDAIYRTHACFPPTILTSRVNYAAFAEGESRMQLQLQLQLLKHV